MTLRDIISPVGVVQPATEVGGYTLVVAENLPGAIETANSDSVFTVENSASRRNAGVSRVVLDACITLSLSSGVAVALQPLLPARVGRPCGQGEARSAHLSFQGYLPK